MIQSKISVFLCSAYRISSLLVTNPEKFRSDVVLRDLDIGILREIEFPPSAWLVCLFPIVRYILVRICLIPFCSPHNSIIELLAPISNPSFAKFRMFCTILLQQDPRIIMIVGHWNFGGLSSWTVSTSLDNLKSNSRSLLLFQTFEVCKSFRFCFFHLACLRRVFYSR